MKVVILSKTDCAGSGYKLYEALIRYTDVRARMFSFTSQNKFGHEQGIVVTKENKVLVQKRVNEADIIHLKGDWPHDGSYCGIDLGNKPIVISVSGSLFRKRDYGGLGCYDMAEFNNCDVKTSLCLDLCYDDFSDIWIPHPIETQGVPVLWQYSEPPLLTHSPTRRISKNTKFALNIFDRVAEEGIAETSLIEGVSFKEADVARRRSTIFFDQFKIGFYGNSAIEAMRYGIPVANWLSPELRWPEMDYYCPVLSRPRDVEQWVETLKEKLSNKHYMRMWSTATRKWCEEVHSYRAVANKLLNIYKQL